MEFPENPAVNMDQLPLLQDVDVLPVDRAYRKMRLLAWGVVQALIFVAVLAPFAGQLLGWLEGVNMGLIWIPLLVQFALGGLWFAEEWLGFERRGYAVRERDITYRTGWLVRNTVTIPYSMIQHSELSQGPVSRWLGLNHIKLFTAGGSGNLRIAGLKEEKAQELRGVIDARAGKS